jgi:transposase
MEGVRELSRFGGQFPNGGYDVHDGSKRRPPARRFGEAFRAQAVRLVLDEGKTIGAVARELDLTGPHLRLWVEQRAPIAPVARPA